MNNVIRAKGEVAQLLHGLIDEAETVYHPDTPSTYAAYQVIIPGGFEIWLNARNLVVISAGKVINRA
jgi:hypothetical protein